MNRMSEPQLSGSDLAEFDEFAKDYDEILNRAIAVSGENKNYFTQGRIDWLGKCLTTFDVTPERVLDYGCGTGTAIPFLHELLGAKHVTGVDVSTASLDRARRESMIGPTEFLTYAEYVPAGNIDVAYCNGVFHHIPISERHRAASCVFNSLRPGGIFGFWENNPWNPGARYCMRANPFDRNAVPLRPHEARQMLSAAGFELLTTNFLFIFPKCLAWFRRLEPLLRHIPFGAQYLVLCQRPKDRL